MEYVTIIDDIQKSIVCLQKSLDQLKQNDERLVQRILLSREDAADFLGISLRQLDRICHDRRLEKIKTIHGVRLRKADLLLLMGDLHHRVNLDF